MRLIVPEEFQDRPVRTFITTGADLTELEFKPVP